MFLPILPTDPTSQYLKTEYDKSLLKSHMGTQYYTNLGRQTDRYKRNLKVVTTKYGKRMPQLEIIYYQLKSLVPEIGCLCESLAKGVPQTLHPCQTSQVIANTIGDLLQPDGETLLLRTQHAYAIKHGESKLVPNQSLHPYSIMLTVLQSTIHATKGDKQSPVSPSYELSELHEQSACMILVHTCYESNQPLADQI